MNEQIFNFSLDLIIDPPKYRGRGRNLLREMYERGFLDKQNQFDFVERCEQLKHIRQQSGLTQSFEADCYDSMINSYSNLLNKYSADDLKDTLRVKQQSLFSISHEHILKDYDFNKLKTSVMEVQDSFLHGLKDTIVKTGKHLSVLFITASTVVLLAKAFVGVAYDLVIKLLHFIYNFVCGDIHSSMIDSSEKIVQQSYADNALTIPFIPAMILQYVVGPPKDILEKIWNSKSTDLVMRRIGYLGDVKVERGLDRIIDWMKMLINKVQRWYNQQILGLEDIPDLEGINHEIMKWNEDVDDILKSYYSGTFVWSESTWSLVYNLYSKGLKFIRSSCYLKFKNDVWKVVSKLGNILELFKTHQRSGTSIRNPPVTVYLAGDTGVGKSSLTYPLAAEILREIFKNEDSPIDLKKHWQSLIYMRSAEQEYWDGYENQLVTVFDDFSQQVDSTSNPNLELFEIIRASNCFPYPLHMASLEQKANTTFTSKIILASSNLSKPEVHSLNFPKALFRRFDICVRVGRKENVKMSGISKFTPDIYTFNLYDMSTQQDLQEISYQDLIELSTQAYYKRRNYVDSIHAYITEKLADVEDIPKQQMGIFNIPSNVTAPIIDDRSFYQRYIQGPLSNVKDQVLTWWANDPWIDLGIAIKRLRDRYEDLMQHWILLQEKHPYLAKMVIMVSLLFTGLMFLMVFVKIKRMVYPQSQKLMTPEAYAESYGDKIIPVVKKESYGEKNIPVVKKEAYNAPLTKVVVRESVRKELADVDNTLVQQQGVKDLNAAEVLMKVARHNLYKMYESSTNTPIGHVMFLKGKIALMPNHYVAGLKQCLKYDSDASVYFEACVLKRSFECRISEILSTLVSFKSPSEEHGPVFSRDLCAVVVPTAIIHTDAFPYFVKRDDVSRVDSTSVMLPVLTHNGLKESDRSILLLRFSEGKSQLKREECIPVIDEKDKVARYVRDVWSYNMDTRPTECGAPLIVRNSQIRPGKICGIHIAGVDGTGQGYATPVYQEDLIEILSSFKDECKFSQKFRLQMQDFPTQQGQVPKDAEFIRLGKINNPLPQPGSTNIRPSLAYASFKEPETKPCTLFKTIVDGKEFDPRVYRLQRLGNTPVVLRQDMINFAREACLDEMSQVISRSEDIISENVKAVYSFNEAVLGIDGELYVNAVKRDTSPGFPFVQMNDCKSRKQFFGNDDVYNLDSPQCGFLRNRVAEIINSAKNGEILDHYFVDTLKDERKPIHKAHKTRLFAAGPLDYLVACKMYFNGVVCLLQKSRNWSHVSVGTNPYSLDWGEIVKSLKRKAVNMIAGDFEGFDASQHQCLLESAGEILIQLSKRFLKATPEDERVMRALLVSLFNSLHITGSEVYQWTHSLPSGHYLTAIINSIFVNLSFGCIWQISHNTYSYTCARSFWERCGIVAYGDDHIVSVPDSDLERFNQFTMANYFKKIGLSYTLEDKDAVAKAPSRLITEVSYLKRTFEFDDDLNRWIAPLSLNTILETPMWIHKCPDEKAQTIANLEFSLKELSLHKENVWKEWAPKLHDECVKLGHYSVYKEQDEVRTICLDQTLIM